MMNLAEMNWLEQIRNLTRVFPEPRSIKAEGTYANALIKSQRLDQKLIEADIQKSKKQGYYSMIYIELEKN